MSVQALLLERVLRAAMKRRFTRDPDAMLLRSMMMHIPRAILPRHVMIDALYLGGVPVERVRSTSPRRDATGVAAIVYVHGGAFVAGSPATHRTVTWRLAHSFDAPVYAVDYRLAPEHPFPAGLDDVVHAYEALLARGVAPKSIVVAGDSAGGNLTLATALKLKGRATAQPGALVCFSPATDLAEAGPSFRTNAHSDAIFDPRVHDSVRALYCAAGTDPHDGFVSPVRADVAGLPPTLIQCSDVEVLRDDSVRMADVLRAAGVDVTLDVWPGLFHVWHLAADVVPEAREALADVATFVKRSLPRA